MLTQSHFLIAREQAAQTKLTIICKLTYYQWYQALLGCTTP